MIRRTFTLLEILLVLSLLSIGGTMIAMYLMPNPIHQVQREAHNLQKHFQSILDFVLIENCRVGVRITTSSDGTDVEVACQYDPTKGGAILLKQLKYKNFQRLHLQKMDDDLYQESDSNENSWDLIFDPSTVPPLPEISFFLFSPTPDRRYFLQICSLRYAALLSTEAEHHHEILLAQLQ